MRIRNKKKAQTTNHGRASCSLVSFLSFILVLFAAVIHHYYYGSRMEVSGLLSQFSDANTQWDIEEDVQKEAQRLNTTTTPSAKVVQGKVHIHAALKGSSAPIANDSPQATLMSQPEGAITRHQAHISRAENAHVTTEAQPRPQPLRCSDIESMPKVQPKVATNKCVPQYPFKQNVHALGDIVSRRILESGCWETHIVDSIVDHFGTVPTADRTFIDIGGNIGAFTTTMANLGFPTITVEPFRLNLPLMLETLCRPGSRTANSVGERAKVFKVALSDKSPGQKMCLWSTNSQINNGNARLVPYFEGTKDFGQDKGKVCMEVIHSYTLDELLGFSGPNSPLLSRRPWGLKIDIEGYEALALRGARSLLMTPGMAPCRIWFEYQKAVTVESGANATEIFDFLTKAGYTQLSKVHSGKFVPISTSGPYPDLSDYMATHGDAECLSGRDEGNQQEIPR